jgi:hypothetical protein
VFDARVVNKITNLKIIGAIDNKIAIFHEALDIRVIGIGNDLFNFDIAIDLGDALLGGGSLGQALLSVFLFEQSLPLEICEFDKIAIDNSQFADAGPRQHLGVRGSKGSATDDQNTRVDKSFLTFTADLTKKNLPAVAFVHLIK